MKKSSKKLVSALCAITFLFGGKAAKVEGITKTNVRQFVMAVVGSISPLRGVVHGITKIPDALRHKDYSGILADSIICSFFSFPAVSCWIDFASNLKKENSSKK